MSTSEKQVLQPGPNHPITIGPHHRRVVVIAMGLTIADTRRALSLREATYPLVIYIPAEDVDFSHLEPTTNSSYCPFKGQANYYSILAGGERLANAVWEYREPFPAVAEIVAHLAFYSDKVEFEE